MKVKELSVEQLKALIQEAVEEKLQEVLGDPDQGLELKEDIKKRLKHSLAAVESRMSFLERLSGQIRK